MTATAWSPEGTPTWKCTPWIIIRRAGHWILSTSRAYRSSSVRRRRFQLENGCTPVPISARCRRRRIGWSSATVAARSAWASAGVAHTPVISSRVDWKSSWWIRGCAPPGYPVPASARTSGAAHSSSSVSSWTSPISISTPRVWAGELVKGISMASSGVGTRDGAQARATTLLDVVPDPVGSAVAHGGPGSAAVAAGSVATARAGAEVARRRRQRGGRRAGRHVRRDGRRAGRRLVGRWRVPHGAPPRRRGPRARLLRRHSRAAGCRSRSSTCTSCRWTSSTRAPSRPSTSAWARSRSRACWPGSSPPTTSSPASRWRRSSPRPGGTPPTVSSWNRPRAILTGLIRELVGLSPESRRLVQRDGRWLVAGDLIRNPDLARFLDLLADGTVTSIESAPFAAPLLAAMRQGGLVTAADLDGLPGDPPRSRGRRARRPPVLHQPAAVVRRLDHRRHPRPPRRRSTPTTRAAGSGSWRRSWRPRSTGAAGRPRR